MTIWLSKNANSYAMDVVSQFVSSSDCRFWGKLHMGQSLLIFSLWLPATYELKVKKAMHFNGTLLTQQT